VTRLAPAIGCVAVCLAIFVAGCTARVKHGVRPGAAHATPAIVAALARREAGVPGLRLSMSVKITGTEHDPLLPSPAYLAVDEHGGIRLEVLSAFGMTVLDLAIRGDAYTVTMPLSHESRDGTIDLRALADPAVPVGDRMIVALALMFRPKARAESCRGSGPATVTCTTGAGLSARTTVDEQLRPIHESYLGADGRSLLDATFADYRGDDAAAQPGSLLIEEVASGARMAIQVKQVKRASPAPAASG
jgi:hypothetical protein